MKLVQVCFLAAVGLSMLGCGSGDATEITPPKTVTPPAAGAKSTSQGMSQSSLGAAPGADKMQPGSKAGN